MKTQIESKKLYEKRNYDDIFVRNVIGGLLKVLNNKLVYTQVWEDSSFGIEEITIPFFYEIGNKSSERFLQDNYLTFGSQCGFKQINGNFDMIPRGVISLTGLNIESDSITNRMVMGEYQKEDPTDGRIKTYVAYLYSIPLKMTFDCEIKSSSFTEMLKISQACNEFFYKNKTFYVTYKGMKLGCRVGFPDSFLGEKNTGFTMGGSEVEKNNYSQKFELNVECYQPVFDPKTERLKSNKCLMWSSGIEVLTTSEELIKRNSAIEIRTKEDDEFFFTAPYYYDYTLKKGTEEFDEHFDNRILNGEIIGNSENVTYESNSNQSENNTNIDNLNLIYFIDDFKNWHLFPSDSIMTLRWDYRKHNSDITNVLIEFVEDTDEYKDEHFLTHQKEKTIITICENNLSYDWFIPKDFTGFNGTDLVIYNDNSVFVYKEPIIKIIPDPRTSEITEESIFCLDPGYFICNLKNEEWDKKEENIYKSFSYYTHINAEISYKQPNGKMEFVEILLPIKDNKIETCEDNPNRINFERVIEKPIKITYTDIIPYRKGNLKISDPNNPRISSTIQNVYIV